MTGELRVAVVHPFCWPEVRRGAERYLDDLARYLAEAGHRVDVVTGTTGQSRVEPVGDVVVRRRHRWLEHRLHRADVSAIDAFGAIAYPSLLRHRYDVVHALVPSAAIAARASGQRTLYTVLGHPTPDQIGVRRLDAVLWRTALRAAHRVAVLSSASHRSTSQLTTRQLDVLPPGVRTASFPPRLSPRTGPIRLLFSADASDDRKGADVLLRAFARVLARRPDARLLHSGAGSIDRALAALAPAERALVDPAVDRLGPGAPADVPARYAGATLTALPARQEAFGLAVVESLAAGTPVVCADDGGPPEILRAGDPDLLGRIVPVGDVDALATAIEQTAQLAADPATPQRCSDHAARWDWTANVGPQHVELYRTMAARRSRPRR